MELLIFLLIAAFIFSVVKNSQTPSSHQKDHSFKASEFDVEEEIWDEHYDDADDADEGDGDDN